MFTTALFMIAETREQSNAATDGWKKQNAVHMMRYYSAIKRRKLATTWMGHEGLTLSNITQRKTNTACSSLYVQS